jgi:Flp pilus assembly protein TadG
MTDAAVLCDTPASAITAMKHPSQYRQRYKRAQILVVLAMSLPALIGAIALSADVGALYFNWQMLQTAADSAAVAGAAYLPSNSTQAISTANAYASRNGILAGEITSTTVSSNSNSLNIQLRRTVPYSFALLLGLVTGSVSAQATAQIQTIGKTVGVTPIGIDYRTQYSSGQVVTLLPGQVGAGNWGSLALGGTGSSILSQNIENGYQGRISVGDFIPTETGMATGPIQSAFNYRINEGQSLDSGGTFSSHTATDPRVLIVPMVDFSNINGSSQVPVKGFAALWLVSVDSHDDISTYFINQVAAGSTPDASATNYGAYKAVLVQ